MSNENRLIKINQGNLASIALRTFEETVNQRKESLLQVLLTDYRSGKLEYERLLTFVASIAALEDLLTRLRGMVKNAEKLNKEVIENDRPPDPQ